MHNFIGKVTLGHHAYFIKLTHRHETYMPYNEHKAQDISRQLLLWYDWNKAYIRIAEPLYSFTKVKTDWFYDGFIIYPFEENIKLLGENNTLTKKYYTQIKDTLSLNWVMRKKINDIHERNISYKYDDNWSLIFTVFDLWLWYAIDKVHNLYPHAPRPPKPPRHTNI